MTVCRSSFFLAETRSSSPWTWARDALRAFVPDDLGQLLGVVLGDALLEGHRHPVLLAGQLGVGRVQGLQRDAPLDQLVLEHVQDRLGALLAVGLDVDRMVAGPGDGRAHATEVEPRADLLGRLVERVVHFLAVEFGHDVKGRLLRCHGFRLDGQAAHRHAERAVVRLRSVRLTVWPRLGLSLRCRPALAAYGRLPEWPKGAVCKTVGSAYVGSNPTPATTCENGPLAAEMRPGGPFPSCHDVYHRVPL